MKNTDRISLKWKARPLTAREYLIFNNQLLKALTAFDDVFHGLFFWHGDKNYAKYFYQPNDSDFDKNVFIELKKLLKNIRFQNPDSATNEMTMDSLCFKGFSTDYKNYSDINDKEYLEVSVRAGIPDDFLTNLVNIKFSHQGHPQFYDHEFMQRLMRLMIEHCQPDYGTVLSHRFDVAAGIWDIENDIHITAPGWFTYVADPKTPTAIPSDITKEILPSGGTLMTLMDEFPDADNPEHVATAIRVRDHLIAANILQ